MNANEKINKYYDEYKNFMKISDMPLIVPVERKEAGDYNALAYLDRDFIKGNAIPIMYMDFLFDYNESFIRSIFFHEFTHIYMMPIKVLRIWMNQKLILQLIHFLNITHRK